MRVAISVLLRCLISCVVLVLGAVSTVQAQSQSRPNVVIILTDDMGYGDLSSQGAQGLQTPHLDRMAAEGVRCTDFYVPAPVCTASRAGLLTGCYPSRVSVIGAVFPEANVGLNPDETTIAESLRSVGYATGFYGKWHVGHRDPFLPTAQGFDEYYGIPYSHDLAGSGGGGRPPLPLLGGTEILEENPDPALFTRRFTDRALAFVEGAVEHDRPFLMMLSHPMPHVPLAVSPPFDGVTGQGIYADVIAEIDWSVGQVFDTLDRLGVDDDTLVMFLSDNGPWLVYGDHAGSAGGLREGKLTSFDGGVRVPFLARWPGEIPAGTTCDTPMMAIDLLPTIVDRVGAPRPVFPIDGKDIWPQLSGSPTAVDPRPELVEGLLFYFQVNALEAVRSGRWKLQLPHAYWSIGSGTIGNGGAIGQYGFELLDLELYDLSVDPGEQTDVKLMHPTVVTQLMQIVDQARLDFGDVLTGQTGSLVRPLGVAN